jgi:hypothetical protein
MRSCTSPTNLFACVVMIVKERIRGVRRIDIELDRKSFLAEMERARAALTYLQPRACETGAAIIYDAVPSAVTVPP